MRRSALDKLISYVGLALAAVMFVAGGLLTWASAFVNEQVTNQLVSQRIDMPNEKSIAGLKDPKDQEALRPYIGQQMSTGDQAKAFADSYISRSSASVTRSPRAASRWSPDLPAAERPEPSGFGRFRVLRW